MAVPRPPFLPRFGGGGIAVLFIFRHFEGKKYLGGFETTVRLICVTNEKNIMSKIFTK